MTGPFDFDPQQRRGIFTWPNYPGQVVTSPADPTPTVTPDSFSTPATRLHADRGGDSLRVRPLLGATLALLSIGGLLVASLTTRLDTAVADGTTPALAAISDTLSSSIPAETSPSPSSPSTSPASTPSSVPSPTQWNVFFIGDSLLTRRIAKNVNPFAKQKPLIGSASLSVVNVETAITNSTKRQTKEYVFNSPPRFAELMSEAGIDVGSLANNHSLDYGDQGLIDSIDALKDASITPIGAGVNLDAAIRPSVHLVGDIKVAIFAASQVIPNGSWLAMPNRIGVASLSKGAPDLPTKAMLEAIRQAKASNDVVLVMMHWGIEKDSCPTPVQIKTGKMLRDAGATAVVGAHPHVLQPIATEGDGIVAYSIGNFIWDPRSGVTADTGILELKFTGKELSGVVFHAHTLDRNGWAVPASRDANRRVQKQVSRKCKGADGSTPWPGNR